MAKLSARGRTELFRLEQTTDDEKGGRTTRQRAYMSDGKVLSRTMVYRPGEKRMDWGWNVAGEFKRAAADVVIAKRQALGWRML